MGGGSPGESKNPYGRSPVDLLRGLVEGPPGGLERSLLGDLLRDLLGVPPSGRPAGSPAGRPGGSPAERLGGNTGESPARRESCRMTCWETSRRLLHVDNFIKLSGNSFLWSILFSP